MYFQYDTNGAPLGFIYNGVQYFYFTNQMGDVIAVTEADGNVIGEYIYDAWGKELEVCTLGDDYLEQTEAVNNNPLRYRGYYYDNETDYYYLQSRYYDASICRFINSDIFEFANIQIDDYSGTNLFDYCVNDPINKEDSLGTTYLNTYINIMSVQVRGNCITINYKVKARIPGLSSISIGYEYPASTRTSGSKKLIKNKIGTHSIDLKTAGLKCYYRVYGIFTARNYNEKTIIKTLSNLPTGKQTIYHEVTKNEEIREKIALFVLGIATTISWKTKILKYTFTFVSVCTAVSAFSDGPPKIKKGQYYKSVSYYKGNYLYTELSIWHSKKSYNHGDYPAYKSKSKTRIPHF